MSWKVAASRNNAELRLSKSGEIYISGGGIHELCIGSHANIDRSSRNRILNAACGWAIASPEVDATIIDGSARGWLKRVNASPHLSHRMFVFFSDPDLLGIWIVVTSNKLAHVIRFVEMLIAFDSLELTIGADFWGFPTPEAQTETPTPEEFSSGKPLFFENVDFRLKHSSVRQNNV